MIQRTSVEVRRASHVQNVPQIGFAQIMPITNVTVVKTRPTTAPARASRSAVALFFPPKTMPPRSTPPEPPETGAPELARRDGGSTAGKQEPEHRHAYSRKQDGRDDCARQRHAEEQR